VLAAVATLVAGSLVYKTGDAEAKPPFTAANLVLETVTIVLVFAPVAAAACPRAKQGCGPCCVSFQPLPSLVVVRLVAVAAGSIRVSAVR